MGQTIRMEAVKTLVGCLGVLAAFGTGEAQVILSEVMFDPSGSEFYDEFIEIQNLGEQPVDLKGWRLGDGEETDEIVPREGATLLQAGAFGLVLDAGYFAHSTRYAPLPEEALILTVEDATLGKGGLGNARPERVVLIAPSEDTIASMTYRVGNRPGHSEEKIDPRAGDGPENWADSRWEGGTPGRINSVSPKADDLALLILPKTPLEVRAGEQETFELIVVNRGQRAAKDFQVEVSDTALALVWAETGDALAPGDSLVVAYPITGVAPGRYVYSARARFRADQDTSNNRVSWEVVVGAHPFQVVVNEVMFVPPAREPEWVELLNRSEQVLDMSGWQIQDSRPAAVELSGPSSLRLLPGGYAVVAEDTGRFRSRYPDVTAPVVAPGRWPRLNDGGDAVVIRDATGCVVDSMVYGRQTAPASHRSLERIDPDGASSGSENWLFSTDGGGATPGQTNSVSRQGQSEGVRLSASPNPFRERVEITYSLSISRADVNLWVFDRLGHRVKTLLNAEPGGGRRRVDWDGAGERGRHLKPGIYILYLEAAGPDGRVYRARTPVVLARGL